jgi:signal transduction histidine kinase
MREHLRQHGVGYLVAVGATTTVALVRFLMSGLLGDATPFLPFALAVLLSAWHGGLKPGLLATVLSAGIAVFLFTEPHYSFRIAHQGELGGLFVFLAIGVTASWVCGAFHAARRRSEADRERLGQQVTEQRRAEEALRESEAKIAADLEAMTRLYDLGTRLRGCDNLQAALDDLLEGAILASQADFGNVQLYNPQIGALKIVAQRGFRQDFLDYFRTVRVDEGSACAQAMQSGERIIIEDVDLDTSYEPHRRIAAAAGYRGVQSTPLKSRTGNVVGMLSTHFRQPHCLSIRDQRFLDLYARLAADLIERVRSDEALREQTERLRKKNERLHLLAEAAQVLLQADDPNAMLRNLFAKIGPHLGLDTYFNFMVNEAGDALRLASCTGIPEATARSITRLEFGQAICGTVAEQHQPLVATFIQQSDDPKAQLVKSFGIRAYVCNPLLAGDHLLGTLSFASRSRDQFGATELQFLQTICRYVTVAYERIRLIQQLREAHRRKDEFLATLAHELRNPLAPIRNALELLRRADGNDNGHETGQQARSMMERQVQRMVRLIDDLLEISRISRGKVQLRKERVELAAVVQSAAEAARPCIEAQGHELTVTLPPEPVYLDADPTRLEQVFANLLDNAAKYTEKGGHVWLTAERQGDEVVVSVRDTGIGIPAEHLPRIFEMFSQVASALERSHGGLGIGLALVKGLVEMHGGFVEARSGGVGKGSEFTVTLPVVEAPVWSAPEPSGNGHPARFRSKYRILVVDDNRDAADSLAMMLTMMGHEIQKAYDGLAAVQAAAASRPDVVLLDIGLPKMNGYEAARYIREQPWGGHMIVIAVTGWGQEEDRRRALEAGCDHHLTKPVDPAALEKLLAVLAVPVPA